MGWRAVSVLSMRPTKWILGILVVLLGLWLAWLLIANLALRSAKLRSWINRKPDRFFLDWQSASTWFPGVFRVRGARFIGQGTRSVYLGGVEEARFRIRWLPLLWKTIDVGRFEGRGIGFRLRRPGQESGATQGMVSESGDHQPPIPGLEQLPRRTAPRRPRGAPSWWIRVADVRLDEVHEVWLYGSRWTGTGELSARMEMQVEGPFQLRVEDLRFPSATLAHEGSTVGTNLDLRVAGSLGPLVFGVDDEPGDRIYEFITADLRLGGDLQTLSLLRQQLGRHDSIEFVGGGRIGAEVRLERGNLGMGSRAEVRAPILKVNLHGYTFLGEATVRDEVVTLDGRPVVRLEMEWGDLEVWRGDREIGRATGPALELRSTAHELGLGDLFRDAALTFRLGPVTVTDVSSLGAYLPKGMEAELTGGTLVARAEYDEGGTDGERGAGVGRLQLAGQGLSATLRGDAYETDLRLEARFTAASRLEGRLDLRGTVLELTNVFVPRVARERQEGWYGRVALDQADLAPAAEGEGWRIDARVGLELRDTRPILGVLQAQPGAPGWLGLVPTLRGIRGEAGVGVTPDSVELRGVSVEGDGVESRAELRMEPQGLRGIVYARYGLVSAGFDLRSAERSWRILGAKRWYEEAVRHPFGPGEEDQERPSDMEGEGGEPSGPLPGKE